MKLTGRDMFSAAMTEAFEGLPNPAEIIDAVYVGNQSEQYEHQIMYGTLLAEWAGLRNIPAERVEACAAAGSLAFRHAVEDVRAGRHDVVLAAGVEKMSGGDTASTTAALSAMFDRAIEQRSGVTAPSQYAMLARRYMYEHGVDEEDLARIAVKNHRNGANNPRAHIQSEIDIEEAMSSRYIAPPFKLYDCAPMSDGSAAILVTSRDIAEDLLPDTEFVTVAGSSSMTNNVQIAERDMTHLTGIEAASDEAYRQSGLSAADIDVAEVHDCFTVMEALISEAAGFGPRGSGCDCALDPPDRADGWTDVQINTSGGLKARGHPTGATGLAQIIEVEEQLTNAANPSRQVADATHGLTVNVGGIGDSVAVAHAFTSA